MKKFLSMCLVAAMSVSLLAGCGSKQAETPQVLEGAKVWNVCNLVNGSLGDRSFFDSAEAGLSKLKADGRITYKTIEMGATQEDQAKWQSVLEQVSSDGEYDVIICGTYQMPGYLQAVAAQYPDQKYLIYDETTASAPNIANIAYAQNDLGYIVGTYAAAMTSETSVDKINEAAAIGFIGGIDSPVINDFLYGYISGAQAVNPDIKVDTRYAGGYVDTAKAKELSFSMINDNNVDIIWGVAGNAGNGAVEAALETGKAYFLGVDSDMELTLPAESAAITLTSGLKQCGNSLIWFFDELDAGREHYGTLTVLGINDGGVDIVLDKNYDKLTPASVKEKVTAAIENVKSGSVVVPTTIGNESKDLETLRDSVKP